MVIDIFGGEKANVPYLIKNPTALVVRGDPEITEGVITNLDFVQRFCSGCMSFNESLTIEKVIEHIDEFEKAIAAGLPKGALNTLWVRHTDKDRTELHFVIPQVDLLTGRQLTIYLDGRDRRLMNGIRDVINVREGYTRPDDPKRKITTSIPLRAAQSKKDFMLQLDAQIGHEVAARRIKNREDVVRFLEGEGLIVKRSAKGKLPDEYLKVRRPDEENFTGLRGAYFRKDFTLSSMDFVNTKVAMTKEQELSDAKERLAVEMERRAHRQKERHVMADRAAERRANKPEKNAAVIPPITAETAPLLPPRKKLVLEPNKRQEIAHEEHRIANPFSAILTEARSFLSSSGSWFDRKTKAIGGLINGLFKSAEETESGAEKLGSLSSGIGRCCQRLLGALRNLDDALAGFEDSSGGGGVELSPAPHKRPLTQPPKPDRK